MPLPQIPDLDEVFSYQTFKVVRVKDRYLGLSYYFAIVAIFSYIIYEIVENQLYLLSGPPVAGSVRVSIKRPDNYSTLPSPAYCQQNAGCMYWSEVEIPYPEAEEGGIFITTRVTTSMSSPPPSGCDYLMPTNMSCSTALSTLNNKQTFYIANIEDFTLMIEHSVRSDAAQTVKTNAEMTGTLVYAPGTPLGNSKTPAAVFDQDSKAAAIANKIPGDVVSIKTLLNAAGVDLDAMSQAISVNLGETIRSAGIVLTVVISYNNQIRDASQLVYKYVPSMVARQEYKVLENVMQPNGSFMQMNRHGIRIEFVQTGTIGVFDFLSLLRNLVAAFGLLSVARISVELAMLMIFPHRRLYSKAKYENTDDFSDIRDAEKASKMGKQQSFIPQHGDVLNSKMAEGKASV